MTGQIKLLVLEDIQDIQDIQDIRYYKHINYYIDINLDIVDFYIRNNMVGRGAMLMAES